MTNKFNYLFQYLDKENINIDKEEFLFQNQSHPDYPSALAIADTLSFFNIHIDIPSTKPDLEIEYLVLYQKNKPQNSAILINYPVRNTDDFEKYKLLFKNNIPKNVFKRD